MMRRKHDATDLADMVIERFPNGTKTKWGRELFDLASSEDRGAFLDEQLVTTLGSYVANRHKAVANARQAANLRAAGVVTPRKPLSPMMSSRAENKMQPWTLFTPAAFIDAVLREQGIVDGRNSTNAIRVQLVEQIQRQPSLMALEDMGAVCAFLGIDPESLGLDDLAS